MLDVVRDARWGRVEETIGEDPYLVGTVASAYIPGLESADVVATLKHFVGYSASKGGRNLAPVSIGPRELADVLLPPFEMAVRESGVRWVMNAYTDMDGVATAADPALLTGLLRDTWGFDGTVVADYFAIGFLKLLHGVAADWVDAGRLALAAGIDVELPTVKAFGAAFVLAVEDGRVDAALVDRALRRVLRQKAGLGLLDADWSAVPSALDGIESDPTEALRGRVDLDPPDNRALARRLAEEAVVLLRTTARCRSRAAPDRGDRPERRRRVRGARVLLVPGAHRRAAPGCRWASSLPTLFEALAPSSPAPRYPLHAGTTVDGGETDGIAAAVALASAPMSWCSPSATGPACSAAAPAARAATPRVCALPGAQQRAARGRPRTRDARSSSCCWPGGPMRSAPRGGCGGRRSCRPSSPGEEGDRRHRRGAQRSGEPERAAAGGHPGAPALSRPRTSPPRSRAAGEVSTIDPTPAYRVRARPRLLHVRVVGVAVRIRRRCRRRG